MSRSTFTQPNDFLLKRMHMGLLPTHMKVSAQIQNEIDAEDAEERYAFRTKIFFCLAPAVIIAGALAGLMLSLPV